MNKEKRLFLMGLATVFFIFLTLVCGCASEKSIGAEAASPSPAKGKSLVIKVLDVGQGDAILIRTDEQTVLLDTSYTAEGRRLRSALHDEGVTVIDKLIITHPHSDHAGGTSVVFRTYRVKSVYDNGQSLSTGAYKKYLKTISKRGIPHKSLSDGDVLSLGNGAVFRVLSPTKKMIEESQKRGNKANININSVVARIEYGNFTMMMTGDAEKETELGILERHSPGEIRSRVLKSGHHGSKTSSSEAFLKALHADDVIISCGEGNEYHLPHPSTLARYRERGMDFYSTDRNGTVTVTTDGKSYKITPSRGEKNERAK